MVHVLAKASDDGMLCLSLHGANPDTTVSWSAAILLDLHKQDFVVSRLKLPVTLPVCPYCGHKAELVDSKAIHPHASQDYGKFWRCEPCDAYVGCHANSKWHAPLGRLANKELRECKVLAHKAFDPLWQKSEWSRQEGYDWLTQQMGNTKQVHIGYMDVSDCRRVVEICEDQK